MYGGLTLYMTKRTELLYGALSKYACDLLYTPRVDITYPLCCWMPLPRHMLYACDVAPIIFSTTQHMGYKLHNDILIFIR